MIQALQSWHRQIVRIAKKGDHGHEEAQREQTASIRAGGASFGVSLLLSASGTIIPKIMSGARP